MALKLVIRNKLRVPVKGSIVGEDGKPVPFGFVLMCDRLSQTQIDETLKNKEDSVVDFLQRVANGWEDVLDADGQPLPFDVDNFNAVLDQAGLPGVCFQAYMKEVGAVAKN
jgi:hypothetical protein